MGIETILGVLAAAGGAGTAAGAVEARKSRKEAQKQSELDRQQLQQLSEKEEPVMPLPDDEAVKRARRRSISAMMGRKGRRSTILTGGESYEPLGGPQ